MCLQITDQYGATALHDAATYNELGVARLLLTRGARIDARDDEGGTPLHNACMRPNNTDMIKLLVDSMPPEKKIEVNELLNFGVSFYPTPTPLQWF